MESSVRSPSHRVGSRDRSPEELEIWGNTYRPPMHRAELSWTFFRSFTGSSKQGVFVHEGWWDGLLKDAEALS